MFQMCMRQNVTDCTDHLAHRCPGVVEKDRVDLSLFMQSNIEAFSTEEDEEDLVLCSFTFEPNPQNGCSEEDLEVERLFDNYDPNETSSFVGSVQRTIWYLKTFILVILIL